MPKYPRTTIGESGGYEKNASEAKKVQDGLDVLWL